MREFDIGQVSLCGGKRGKKFSISGQPSCNNLLILTFNTTLSVSGGIENDNLSLLPHTGMGWDGWWVVNNEPAAASAHTGFVRYLQLPWWERRRTGATLQAGLL